MTKLVTFQSILFLTALLTTSILTAGNGNGNMEIESESYKVTAEDCFWAVIKVFEDKKLMKSIKEKYERLSTKGSVSSIEQPVSLVVDKLEYLKDECSQESIYKDFELSKRATKLDPSVYKYVQRLYRKIQIIEETPSRMGIELLDILLLLMRDIKGH